MADKQDPKEELIPVGPGADEKTPVDTREDSRAGEEYSYPEGDDEDSPGRHEPEARAGHSETEDETDERGDDGQPLTREQKRRRRKREKYERDQRELGFLRQRNEQLERENSSRLAAVENRQSHTELSALDARISQGEADLREAESLLAQAMDAKDNGAVVEALRVRDELRDGLNQHKTLKSHATRTLQAQRAAPQGNTPDPRVASMGQAWARENPWFDPNNAADSDSQVAWAEDRALAAEGRLDPRTQAYWAELDRRLAKRMPERYRNQDLDDDEDEREERDPPPKRGVNGNGKRRPSGPEMRVGGRERPLRQGEVYIDPERRAAMEEAGVWDDPVLRARYLKQYQRFDREHGRRRH